MVRWQQHPSQKKDSSQNKDFQGGGGKTLQSIMKIRAKGFSVFKSRAGGAEIYPQQKLLAASQMHHNTIEKKLLRKSLGLFKKRQILLLLTDILACV